MLKIKKNAFSLLLMHNIFSMEDNNLLSHLNHSETDLIELMNNEFDYKNSLNIRNKDLKNCLKIKNTYNNKNSNLNNIIIANGQIINSNNNNFNVNNNIIHQNYRRNSCYNPLYILGSIVFMCTVVNYFDVINPFPKRKNLDTKRNFNNCIDLSNLCVYKFIIEDLKDNFKEFNYKDFCFGKTRDNNIYYKTKFEFNEDPNCILLTNKLQYNEKSILKTIYNIDYLKVIYNYNNDLSYAFSNLSLDILDIYNLDMQNVLKIKGLFYNTTIKSLLGYEYKKFYNTIHYDNVFEKTYIDHPLYLNWDINIDSAKDSFKDAEIYDINIDNFNTNNLKTIYNTFNSISIKFVSINSFNTKNVINYVNMFNKNIKKVEFNINNNPRITNELESYNMICENNLCTKEYDHDEKNTYNNSENNSNNGFFYKYINNTVRKLFRLFNLFR